VIGTRPEAIKLQPLAHALRNCGVLPTLVFTGQHAGLDPAAFGLDEFPRIDLRCAGRENPHLHVQDVTQTMLPLLRTPPDVLVVQGDTSSALGAALAGFTAGIPVAHVEAGLRTYDTQLPWPEEEYRTAIDTQAEILFAPTERAAENLRAERVTGDIHVTGNTGIDALMAVEQRLPGCVVSDRRLPQILVTCHRRESWGEGLASIGGAVRDLARHARINLILHPNARVAGQIRALLADVPGVSLVAPCGHPELVRRMRDADLILSDSGGIQEEAPALGVPLLVLRDKTERPEAIEAGAARLVGTDADRIVSEARRLLDDPSERAAMSRRVYPFGDGRAAPRIAAIIATWLEQTQLARRLA